MEISLNRLPLLKLGNIKNLLVDKKTKCKLLSLGFIPETAIKPVFSNFSGNLRAYEVRKAIIALRDTDANKIRVDVSI